MCGNCLKLSQGTRQVKLKMEMETHPEAFGMHKLKGLVNDLTCFDFTDYQKMRNAQQFD